MGTPAASIIIAGRNSAAWVAEAIGSALRQTSPCDVIFADDCSTDNTLDVARSFEADGLRISTTDKHGGVCSARNRGARLARGENLCFVDADDVLPPDYIAQHLAAMVPGCPFVYGAALAFGGGPYDGRLWPARSFEEWDRWSYNTVNTSALYAKWAFRAAGEWIDGPTMWDHDLALRASRIGYTRPRVSRAVLRYRQHPGSFSNSVNEKADELVPIREEIRRRVARLSVATIYSGRLPALFPQWIERVAQSVRFAGISRPDLMIAYDPRAVDSLPAVQAAAAVWSNSFSSIEFIALPPMASFSDEMSRRNAVASWLACACQVIRGRSQDLLWMVEDDILIKRAACRDLWNVATAGLTPPHIVSGVYRSRHCPELLIAGRIQTRAGRVMYPEATELPAGDPIEMDFVGMGCTMLWTQRPAMPATWPSHVAGIPAHDWAIAVETKRAGGTVLWHPGVQCGHANSPTDILWPSTE